MKYRGEWIMTSPAMQREMGRLKVGVEIGGLDREETCEGQGFSPLVRLEGVTSPFLALIMEDAGPPHNTYWMLWNVPRREEIPRHLPASPELEAPIAGRQGRNARGGFGYAAPCPPDDREERYVLRVYGLERKLDLGPEATREDLVRAAEENAREYGEDVMVYSKKHRWSSSADW